MQALDNAKTDSGALVYMKVSETDECEIKDDAECQVSAVSEVGKPWTMRNVIHTAGYHWLVWRETISKTKRALRTFGQLRHVQRHSH